VRERKKKIAHDVVGEFGEDGLALFLCEWPHDVRWWVRVGIGDGWKASKRGVVGEEGSERAKDRNARLAVIWPFAHMRDLVT
jgi:hypothetical protein